MTSRYAGESPAWRPLRAWPPTLATHAVQADTPVLVRIEGPESGDTPCDADAGEVLILPERAEVILDDGLFFETVGALVDAYWEEGVTDTAALTERAEALGL